jgi:hypothetical protein
MRFRQPDEQLDNLTTCELALLVPAQYVVDLLAEQLGLNPVAAHAGLDLVVQQLLKEPHLHVLVAFPRGQESRNSSDKTESSGRSSVANPRTSTISPAASPSLMNCRTACSASGLA